MCFVMSLQNKIKTFWQSFVMTILSTAFNKLRPQNQNNVTHKSYYHRLNRHGW